MASRADEACDRDAAYDLTDRAAHTDCYYASRRPQWVRSDAAFDPSRSAHTTTTPPGYPLRRGLRLPARSACRTPARAPAAAAPAALISATASGRALGGQVGAFSSQLQAVVHGMADYSPCTVELLPTSPFGGGLSAERAQQLSASVANAAYARLAASQPCMVVAPGRRVASRSRGPRPN